MPPSSFCGNDLAEWVKHFGLGEQFLSMLKFELGAGEVKDLQFAYDEESTLEIVKNHCSRIVYRKFLEAKNYTVVLNNSPAAQVPGNLNCVIIPGNTVTPTILPAPSAPSRPPAPSPSAYLAPPAPPSELSTEEKVMRLQQEHARLKEEAKKKKEEEKYLQKKLKKAEKEKQIEKLLNVAISLDLVFVLDCTGSMTSFIENMKVKIIWFVDEVKKLNASLNIRLAFVGYRDYTNKPEERLAVLRFTTNVEEFKEFVSKQKPICNDDEAEDLLGGLNVARNLDWESGTRIVYVVGDSPCHGKEYHDESISDLLPEADPNGLTAQEILYSLRKSGVHFFFGQVVPARTKIMIKKFNEIVSFDPYQPKELPSPYVQVTAMNDGNMMEVMLRTVSITLSSHLSSSFNSDDLTVAKKKEISISSEVPNWTAIIEESILQFSINAVEKYEEIIARFADSDAGDDGCTLKCPRIPLPGIKCAPTVFAQGSNKAAHYGLMTELGKPDGKPVVFKELLKNVPQSEKQLKASLSCHRMATVLSQEFNQVKPSHAPKVEFVDASLVQLLQRPDTPFMIMEAQIPNQFEKYNGNQGYCCANPSPLKAYHDVVQAFSHWTYVKSNGLLMSVDCQGCFVSGTNTFLLFDPAIHCTDTPFFGGTNLSARGMELFFKSHHCNSICRRMSLPPPPSKF